MHRTRTLIASAAAAAALLLSSSPRAQVPGAKHQFGGFVNAVWLERVPLIMGQPDAFRVWTAEDGSRIRVYDSVSDTISEENVICDVPETLHDIYLDQFQTATTERLYGVAVGTNGANFWWDSASHLVWQPFITEPAPGKALWACAVEHTADGTTIWVAGEDHTLRCSMDKGIVWNDGIWLTSPAPGSMFTAMDFADWALPGRQGVVGNDAGELFFTTDGMTWDQGTIHDLPTPADPLIFWDIDFRPGSSTEAFAVGGRNEGNGIGFAWRTTDGGQNWYRVYTHFEATGVARVPETGNGPGNACSGVSGPLGGKYTHNQYATLYGCHVLQNGRAILVAYAGQVWQYLPSTGTTHDILDSLEFTTGPLWGCHGDGDQEVWLSGQFGILRRTGDGGTTWEAKSPNENWRLTDLVMPTTDVGYVLGQSRRIAKTTDGGATWVEQLAFRSGPLRGETLDAIDAFDVDRAVAIGNHYDGTNPVAYFTADGGATCWSESTLPASLPSYAMGDVTAAALDPITSQPTFWICGHSATNFSGLMKSVDGGANFTEVPLLGQGYEWAGIATLGSNTAVVVGRRLSGNAAVAYATFNANAANPTWMDISPTANGRLQAVAVTGAAAVAVASDGRVFEFVSALGHTEFVLAAGSVGLTDEDLHQVELGLSGSNMWAYAVGDHGTVLRGSPGTGFWETLNSRTTDDLRGMAMHPMSGVERVWYTGRNARWGDSTIVRMY